MGNKFEFSLLNSESMSSPASSLKDVIIWTFILTTSYIALTFLNNSIYSFFGCNYFTIHFLHYFVAFIVLFLLTCFGILNYERIPLSDVLPLAISESLISISTSIMFSHGSEQDVILVRSMDIAVHLLIISLANKFLNFSFFNDLRRLAITVFIIFCSAISWSTNFWFYGSLYIAWPMIIVGSVAHYFLAVKTSQKLNITFEMLTMNISGYTSLFLFPFAILIPSDSFLQDFEDGFGIPRECYHYMVLTAAIIFIPVAFVAKYWLISNVNPQVYINTQNMRQAFALIFKWIEEEFVHTNSTNFFALCGIFLGTFISILLNFYDKKTFLHTTHTPQCKVEKNKHRFSLKRKITISSIFFFLFVTFFVYRSTMKDDSDGVLPKQHNIDDDFIADWAADDPRLIAHIRKFYIEPPASRLEPYNLANQGNRDWSLKSQSGFVENYFKRKTNGFFIECGAADGEHMSNTLALEKFFNWSGVLIEPDYGNFQKLKAKKRKSWLVNGCLIDSDKPVKKILYGAFFIGSLAEHTPFVKRFFTRIWVNVNVQSVWCFPLISILKAVNQTKIDYFALDVEGPEIQILKNLHWNQIDINLLQVEYAVLKSMYIARDLSTNRKKQLRNFMKENLPQYKEIKVILYDIMYAKSNNTLH